MTIIAEGGLVRLTTMDAAEAVATIHAAFAVQSVATDPPSAALRETAATIASEIAAGGGAAVRDGAGFAGVVLWRETESGLYFGRLAVRPEWRRRGIARALIATVEDEARRLGLPRVHLGTRLVLADNRALFAACGYREVGLTSHAGFDAPTSVVMEKRITMAACGDTGR